MAMLPAFVDGPGAQPQRGGLVTNALDGDTDVDWLKGVQWWPEDIAGYQLASECSTATTSIGSVDYTRPVMAQPVLIRTNQKAPKSSLLDLADRARRRLVSITSQALARELWLGEQTTAAPYQVAGSISWSNPSPSSGTYTNPYLTMPPALTVTGTLSAPAAVSAVEEALAGLVSGGPLYLHVPMALITELGAVLQRQGDVLMTPRGSVVIADYGYPAPSGSTAAIYGTGPVLKWLGEPAAYDEPSEYLRVSDNHIEVWADRPALALFDPCTLVSAQVTP